MDPHGDTTKEPQEIGGDESFSVASGTTGIIDPLVATISDAVADVPSYSKFVYTRVPEISPMGAEAGLEAPEEEEEDDEGEVVHAESCPESKRIAAESAGWPSVDDVEDDDEDDLKVLRQRSKDSEVSDARSGNGALGQESSTVMLKEQVGESGEGRGSDEDTLEFQWAPREFSPPGDSPNAEDISETAVLKNLRNSTDALLGEREILSEADIILGSEVRIRLRSGEPLGLERKESSTGSVFDVDEHVNLLTRELPEGWVGVEDATSISNTDQQRTHKRDNKPVSSLSPRESGTRNVYRFPQREDDSLASAVEDGSQILSWPIGLAIRVIGFQIKLIVQAFYLALWLCSLMYGLVLFPFRAAVSATGALSTTVRDGFSLASQLQPMMKEGVAQAGPVLKETSKKCGCGCLAALYVIFMLSTLLFPALVLDYFLVRGFIEEPVEFKEVLHFDYTQEHPSAMLYLLPPKVLQKAQTYAKSNPEKAYRIRAIPPAHKFHVTVLLTLPESEYNQRLGMFQVTGELLSVKSQVLTRASWPCMLRFRSSPIQFAKNVLLGVPTLMGLSWETQTLSLRLFENEEENIIPTTMVRFSLEPKAGYPVGSGLPEVYSAEAHVVSVLPWPKALMRNWKWTFYVWSGLSVFMFEIAIVLCCCHGVLLPSRLLRGMTESSGESEPRRVPTPRKSGKHGRRVNFSDQIPTARVVRSPRNKPIDRTKERELLLSSAESNISSLSGPRSRRSGSQTKEDDTVSEATSSWTVPPVEETLDYVDDKVKAVENTVRNLGEAVVEGVTDGVGLALHTMKAGSNSKALKTD